MSVPECLDLDVLVPPGLQIGSRVLTLALSKGGEAFGSQGLENSG